MSGYYKTATSTCEKCTGDNVATCNIKGSALTCAAGFYSGKGGCWACASITKACVTDCLNLGFFTEETTSGTTKTSKCTACSANAASCPSAAVASSCMSGYYLSTAGACVACSANGVACNLALTVTTCA